MRHRLLEAIPLLSFYGGFAGMFFEIVILRVCYHLPPAPEAVVAFGAMMTGLALLQRTVDHIKGTPQQDDPPLPPAPPAPIARLPKAASPPPHVAPDSPEAL